MRLRLLLFLLPLVWVAGCSRTATQPSAEPSLLVVTFGAAPASAFGAPATNAPSMTPVFDSLKESLRSAPQPEFSASVGAAARGLWDEGAVAKDFRAKGYRLGAFVADPALKDLAEGFDEALAPDEATLLSNRLVRATTHLLPQPFELLEHERFLRGDAVVRRALLWLAKEAGIPEEELVSTPAKGRKREKKELTAGALKAPVLLWVHLSDTEVRNATVQRRAGESVRTTQLRTSAAFLDLQLGQLLSFLSEHGLRDSVEVAVLGLTADVAGAEVPVLLPQREVGLKTGFASPEADARAALVRRLHWDDAEDATLVAACQAYCEANPEQAEAWGWLGYAQHRARQPKAALEAQQKAFQLEPKNAFRMSNLGLAFLEVGDVVKAIDHLENAYLADAKNRRYKSNLTAVLLKVGMAFTEQDDFSNAMACLSRVVLLQPENPAGYFAQGRLHEKMGRPELAAGLYRKALEVQPKFLPAKEALARMTPAKPAEK